MNIKKILIIIIFSFLSIVLYSNNKWPLFRIKSEPALLLDLEREIKFTHILNSSLDNQVMLSIDLTDFLQIDNYAFKKKENPIRRAEILFFGSLTIISFSGWLLLSMFNMMIYDEDFGVLRREQFLLLYLGSSFLSISVVISDIFIGLRPKLKLKNIEVY